MITAKDAADREKCPDPRVSTENLMTGHRVMNRLAALPRLISHIHFSNFQGQMFQNP